jgi:hypothetical protein
MILFLLRRQNPIAREGARLAGQGEERSTAGLWSPGLHERETLEILELGLFIIKTGGSGSRLCGDVQ